ncbi:lamin Dm0-like [Musca autumnalis]|uniref:lamin Dm0-like n=1 Tax=Musca autumnalis TaxID=221902 RepID=UPI003CF9575F
MWPLLPQFQHREGSFLETPVGFCRSVGETTERKNENVRADVSLKLKSETNRLREENEQFKSKLDQQIKDCRLAEEKARMYESQVTDVTVKYNAAYAEKEKAVENFCEVQKESECLRQQLDEARKYLNAESMIRTDLQNRIQSLREELTFKEQSHLREIDEIHSRHQAEISAVLQQLREQHEEQMRKLEMMYQQEINSLQAEANHSLNSRINELEATNAALNTRNRDLEELIQQERTCHAAEVVNLEDELRRLRNGMAQQQLQEESAMYDKLLWNEKDMSQPSREKDHIEISQSDLEEMVLKKGTKEVHIGGFQFKPNANDKENDVNFHRSGTIEGDINKLRVSATYEPPINMVMKSQEIQSGASKKASMFNANEEVTGYRTTRADASNVSGYPLRRKWIYHLDINSGLQDD